MFVSNKRQVRAEMIGPNFFMTPGIREGLWTIKISKISLKQNVIIIKLKKTRFCLISANFLLFLFYKVYKKMFIIKI